jgi:polysaccharide export outer membrane protein
MKFDKSEVAKLALALCAALFMPPPARAQQPAKDAKGRQTRQRRAQGPTQKPGERMEPDDPSSSPRADVPADVQASRHESASDDEASVVPYYNNFLSTYRLGPEDVISISLFGSPVLERYSKPNIVIPPNAVVTHPLIPEGIFVGGKTTAQVRDEIIKKLDELVENPKVDVTLEKAQSAVFWVMGDVGQPGIRPMSRRLSVTEALALSGGVLDTGDKSKVVVNRRLPSGFMQQSMINVAAIERGRQPDNFFLQPGDQILVPGNRMKKVDQVLKMLSAVSFMRVFTGGIF